MNKQELYIKRAYQFYAEMGYIPVMGDYRIIPNTPAITTIKKYFGKWSDYIKACDFPKDYNTKKDVDTVFIGDNWSKGNNYFEHLKSVFLQTKHIINKYIPDGQVTYKVMHGQYLFVFEWKKVPHVICFFNKYTPDYMDKIDIMKEVFKDLGFTLHNLNKEGRWYEKRIEDIFNE